MGRRGGRIAKWAGGREGESGKKRELNRFEDNLEDTSCNCKRLVRCKGAPLLQ